MIQKTLIILKPDTVSRWLIGEIISRFERAGLHLAGIKMTHPDKDFYHHHYETISKMISRRWQHAFDSVVDFMMTSPVVAMVWEGIEAVEVVRKIVGPTEPKSAPIGTIRGDYAHISFTHADEKASWLPNLVHASGNSEEASQEVKHRFSDVELFHYDTSHKKFTQ